MAEKAVEIGRIAIWCSQDSCNEFWEYVPLTPLYRNKETLQGQLEHFQAMSRAELENLCEGYIGTHLPIIEWFDLIEEE